jgi:predicted nucleic acid-binding protein
LVRYADPTILIESSIVKRASQLKEIGFGAYDALHLACAEHGDANVFLTTDDKVLRLASKCSSQLKIKVYNPLIWLKEVIENEYRKNES